MFQTCLGKDCNNAAKPNVSSQVLLLFNLESINGANRLLTSQVRYIMDEKMEASRRSPGEPVDATSLRLEVMSPRDVRLLVVLYGGVVVLAVVNFSLVTHLYVVTDGFETDKVVTYLPVTQGVLFWDVSVLLFVGLSF